MNYEKQANDFASKHGIKLQVIDTTYGRHFADDKQDRYIFKLRLTRDRKSYTFNFGQSFAAGAEEPTMYSVLSCLQKYDVGSFKNFCSDFGYDEDSRTAERTYHAVRREFTAVCRLLGDLIHDEEFLNIS